MTVDAEVATFRALTAGSYPTVAVGVGQEVTTVRRQVAHGDTVSLGATAAERVDAMTLVAFGYLAPVGELPAWFDRLLLQFEAREPLLAGSPARLVMPGDTFELETYSAALRETVWERFIEPGTATLVAPEPTWVTVARQIAADRCEAAGD